MNVYWRELKSQRWSFLWWSLGVALLLVASWAKYATLSAPGADVLALLDALPKSVQVIFGLSGFDLGTARGYFGVIYYFTALLLAVHAVLASTDMIAKEEREKTSEFLLVRPVSRARVLTGKLLAGLTTVVALNLVTWALSFALLVQYGGPNAGGDYVALSMLGLFAIQLCFFALGALVAGVNPRPKWSASIAATVLLVTYLATVLTELTDRLDFLRYFSPFSFFDAHQILATNSLDWGFVGLGAGVVTVSLLIGFIAYARRDLAI